MLSWGAFMFGAEFAWAYAPLLVMALTVAALGFLAARAKKRKPGLPRLVVAALALLNVAVLLQLVPLPKQVLKTLSPAHDNANYAELYARAAPHEAPSVNPSTLDIARPLSIEPSRTWLGLAFLVTFSLLLLGSARGLHAVGPLGLVRGIVVIGVIAAFAELIQKASGSSVVYGLWTPRQLGYTSAPFVNRNHTAGWLVMAMSVAMGHLAAGLARGMRDVKPHWRDRIGWLSSRDANEVLLTLFAVALIGTAIVFTESRSGSLSLLIAVATGGSWLLFRQPSRLRKLVALASITVIAIAAVVMGGVDAVGRRFASGSMDNIDGRLDVWRDTMRIVDDFGLTGTGLNTYGIAMLHYQTLSDGFQYIEAHNDYLQVAAEGGLLLVVPVVFLIGALALETRRRFASGSDDTRTYWIRAGAVVGLGAIAFQSVFDFTLQMPGAAALFVLLLALAIHGPGPRFSRAESVREG